MGGGEDQTSLQGQVSDGQSKGNDSSVLAPGITYVLGCTGIAPLASYFVILTLEHLPSLGDSLVQKVQLAEYKTRIERITGPCAHVHNVETLTDQVSHRGQLVQHKLGSTRPS